MLKILFCLLATLLAGCRGSHGNIDRGDYWADTSVASRSQNERVRFLVLHYTAADDAESLRLLTTGEVSAHYLVGSMPPRLAGKPVVRQLVPEQKRAWHAGVSYWQGRENLNDSAIGIEIVNPGYRETFAGRRWSPYTAAQIDLVSRLARDIIRRYQITPDNVVAHSDIAPLRKWDPGPRFPWENLAGQGIGAWPDKQRVAKYLAGRPAGAPASVALVQRALAAYGYRIPQTGVADEETLKTLSAFQMHFRPADISGRPDAETEAIALALVEEYRPSALTDFPAAARNHTQENVEHK
ncbi:N-acetylmuramoyl-L-alanine amidase [Martelella alba]|uniref:N-acetylmuramoyl-L-alanine amidase n=1 Tax=Martelella alba TaxID=2590451 RepID=A0ABY2SL44_9HYPH|nr:N-acetylmuramoyl-L-alanine amidase [Martelella alba]TKI05495.1 N-acetylmuramoyl-L-alanine amidase [Martelella alba]